MTSAEAYLIATREVAKLTGQIAQNDRATAARLVARAALLNLSMYMSPAELDQWAMSAVTELPA